MPSMHPALELTTGMPERRLAPGQKLFDDEQGSSAIAVLVEGRLLISSGGAEIAQVDVPGAFIGEIGALLAVPRVAEVTAAETTVVRHIGDPTTFFHDHPELALELARQLAGRLHRLTAYLADVRVQYADRDDHLGMADALLGRLASRPPVEVEPGSVRSPDY